MNKRWVKSKYCTFEIWHRILVKRNLRWVNFWVKAECGDYFSCPQEQFEQFGKVERVKKIKDYAFVHFEDRDHAVLAMRSLNGKEVGNSNIEVCGDQLKMPGSC